MKDLRVVDRREMELMKRMVLLLQRERERRKEISEGTLVKSDVTIVASWGTLLISEQRRRIIRREIRGLIQLLHQLWRNFYPILIWNFLWPLYYPVLILVDLGVITGVLLIVEPIFT